jgi:hypothetical protein
MGGVKFAQLIVEIAMELKIFVQAAHQENFFGILDVC